MSVWFKYAGDKDITPGHPGGSSIFAPPAGGGGGFPAYGTVLSTNYGINYEIGASLVLVGSTFYGSYCDVNNVADGVGGSFIDWANASNINPYSYGTFYVNDGTPGSGSTYVYNANYTWYSYDSISYYADGNNWYYNESVNYQQAQYGDFIVSDPTSGNSTTYVYNGNYAYASWDGFNYYWDGNGSYYSEPYNYSFASNGDFILNDGASGGNYTYVYDNNYYWSSWDSTDYFWDGTGGYYTSAVNYSEASYGTSIVTDPNSGSNQTMLPDSMYYSYESWASIEYYWSSGGSYYAVKTDHWTASYGDFITTIDGTDYYWDGSGGYFTT